MKKEKVRKVAQPRFEISVADRDMPIAILEAMDEHTAYVRLEYVADALQHQMTEALFWRIEPMHLSHVLSAPFFSEEFFMLREASEATKH